MRQTAAAGQQKPANGQLCLNYLSHPRGQAQRAQHAVLLQSEHGPCHHNVRDSDSVRLASEKSQPARLQNTQLVSC